MSDLADYRIKSPKKNPINWINYEDSNYTKIGGDYEIARQRLCYQQ